MTRVFEEFMQGDAEVLVSAGSRSPEVWARLFTRAGGASWLVSSPVLPLVVALPLWFFLLSCVSHYSIC